jgi:hypothetical protein
MTISCARATRGFFDQRVIDVGATGQDLIDKCAAILVEATRAWRPTYRYYDVQYPNQESH